jgi:hypothetical protein
MRKVLKNFLRQLLDTSAPLQDFDSGWMGLAQLKVPVLNVLKKHFASPIIGTQIPSPNQTFLNLLIRHLQHIGPVGVWKPLEPVHPLRKGLDRLMEGIGLIHHGRIAKPIYQNPFSSLISGKQHAMPLIDSIGQE